MEEQENFLKSTISLFEYYKFLGEKTINQLSEKDLFWQYNSESNSIYTIIKHLSGNMISRWTNIFTEDGEKDWRNRDEEFIQDINSKDELIVVWDKGWKCLFDTLSTLEINDLNKIIYIRNQGHTVMEAINRQLAHYPYHIGQIVFIGKMIKNDQWESLSIPKGKSGNYNSEKFEKPLRKEHFSEEILKKKD